MLRPHMKLNAGNAFEHMKLNAAPLMTDRPFGAPLDIELDLPPPLSVNRTRKLNRAALRDIDRWTKQADALVTSAWTGGRRPKQALQQFEAIIILDEQMNRLDGDNGVKLLIDYARRLGLIADDSKKYMRELRVMWGNAPHGCKLILRAREA